MTKQQILSFLTSYKHKDNEVIPYATLNNIYDSKTLSDINNLIATAVKSRDTNFIRDLIKAIYNVTGQVVYDNIKNSYIILESKPNNSVNSRLVKVVTNDSMISFTLDNNTRKISLELPSVVEKDWKKVKQDIIIELQKENIKSKDDFKKFTEHILHTKF